MHKNILIVVGITILFLGLSIQPSIATVQPKEEMNVEPKDYLFQTIIDIANNPNVKGLLEQYNYKMFTSDYDYKGVFSKLLFKKPRLFFSMVFTKPSITFDYLDKCYKRGIEVTNVLGEEKALEMIELVDVTDTEVLDELNNIITYDEELSDKLATLKEMNEEYVSDLPFDKYPIICAISSLIFVYEMIKYAIVEMFAGFFEANNPILYQIFYGLAVKNIFIGMVFFVLLLGLECIELFPYYLR